MFFDRQVGTIIIEEIGGTDHAFSINEGNAKKSE